MEGSKDYAGRYRHFWWVALTGCCTLPECIKWHGRRNVPDSFRDPRSLLRKAGLLTRLTLAAMSPSRPESAKTASSPRAAPLALARAIQFFMPFLEGAAKAVLDCAHRTIYMLPPSSLVFSLGMGADGSSTARVGRAHSYCARSASTEDHQPPFPHFSAFC